MIGQESIKERLFVYQNASYLPNSMLFLGNKGCGKHTLANEVARHYNMPLLDISKDISQESIEQIYMTPIQAFYLIDMDEVSERQQNVLLKFIEEPLPNSHIILISSSKTSLLDTIVNRCVSYEFRPYAKEELRQFIKEGNEEDILSICTTPGQIESLNIQALSGLHDLCQTIVDKLGKAKYPNALVIAKKINYKDEYDKYDFDAFLNCLKLHLFNDYINNNSKLSLDLYYIVNNECKLLAIPNINKEYFMEHMITTMWERSKDEIKRVEG